MSEIKYGLDPRKGSKGLAFKVGVITALLIVTFIVISSMTTQGVAKHFAYNPVLGEPIYNNWYSPFKWLEWRSEHGERHGARISQILQTRIALFAFIAIVPMVFMAFTSGRKGDKHKDLHGSASFAKMQDIIDMGLTKGIGLPVLGYYIKNVKNLLYYDGGEHQLIVAPTGSGKGVSNVIATALTCKDSMVIYDLKKEIWAMTSAYRKSYLESMVLLFEPTNVDNTATCWNPLEEMRIIETVEELNSKKHKMPDGTTIVKSLCTQDAQTIAEAVVDDTGKGVSGNHFESAALDLLTALILHSRYKAARKNLIASLPTVLNDLDDPDREDMGDLWEEMMNYGHFPDGSTHPVVATTARSMANKADKELSGIISSATIKMSLYRDPIVAANIAKSEFRIHDLMNHDKPVSLYIHTPPSDATRLRPITRLLLTLICKRQATEVFFEKGREVPLYKHKLKMLIDEFPTLGKLKVIESSLAFLRGFGISLILYIQDFTQLRSEDAYGRNESIVGNCKHRIVFTPLRADTAKEISDMAGVTTVTKTKVSNSRGKGIFSPTRQSITEDEQKRPLITPDEVLRMPAIKKLASGKMQPGAALVFTQGEKPIMGEQYLYFQDESFLARTALGCPDVADKIEHAANSKVRSLLTDLDADKIGEISGATIDNALDELDSVANG